MTTARPAKGAEVTAREAEVLALLGRHLSNVQIAEALCISVRTVESHVTALLRKLGRPDRRSLARYHDAEADAPVRSGGSTRSPQPGELIRRRLLDVLARRFQVPVIQVAGGAGFGKTTLLAQARRANHVAPCGIDVELAHDVHDWEPAGVAATVARALGYCGQGEPLAVMLGAVRSVAPLPVCLVADDAHELHERLQTATLLTGFLRARPENAHLVLCGRKPPPLPLARLRARGEVIDVGEADLVLTDAEVAALAAGAGRRPDDLGDLGGWPALIGLALAAPAGTTVHYLWEEVVAGLDPAVRGGLVAVSALGTADDAVLAEVADEPAPVGIVAAAVPLVRLEDGRLTAHALWRPALQRVLPDEMGEARRRALRALERRGDFVHAGSLAAEYGDGAALRRAAKELVRQARGAFRADTAAGWLDGASEELRATPDLRLLAAARRHAARLDDDDVARDLEQAMRGFVAAGDTDGEIAGLTLASLIARSRNDHVRFLAVAARARQLAGKDGDPTLRVLAACGEAAVAELAGDVEGALAVLEGLDYKGAAPSIVLLTARLHVNVLVLAGRADEAVALADRWLADSPDPHVRLTPGFVRWLAGDPSGLGREGARPEAPPGTAAMDRFRHAAFAAVLYGSGGDPASVAAARAEIDRVRPAQLDARGSAFITGALVAHHVLGHDEEAARDAVARHLLAHPLDNPVSELHLRRFLPLAYILHPDVRARWDGQALGPAQARARSVARALLDARAGKLRRRTPLPPPPAAFTMLPLPWSVELAARAEAAANLAGRALVEFLVDRLGPVVGAELRTCAGTDDPTLAEGARGLLEAVPATFGAAVRVEVLGPLHIVVDGQVQDRPELRRARVRELLGLLVVEPALSRERAMDRLWPDHSPAAAASNLRVTLTYLRRLLAGAEGACPFLRADGATIQLLRGPSLDVDLWEVRDLLAASGEDGAGLPARMARLELVAARWRPEPISDLARLPDVVGVIDSVRSALADALLDLGELQLIAGSAAPAARRAEQVLDRDPCCQRAHRLAIAAQVQHRDQEGLLRAVARLQQALRETGMAPEPATQALLAQAGGPPGPGAVRSAS